MLLYSIPRLILVKSARIRPDEPVCQGYRNQYDMTRLMIGLVMMDADHQTRNMTAGRLSQPDKCQAPGPSVYHPARFRTGPMTAC